jgi:hypothetical protein
MVSAFGELQATSAEPLDEPDDDGDVGGLELEEHAAISMPAAPKATPNPTAAKSLDERMIEPSAKLMVDLIPNSGRVEQPREGTSWADEEQAWIFALPRCAMGCHGAPGLRDSANAANKLAPELGAWLGARRKK